MERIAFWFQRNGFYSNTLFALISEAFCEAKTEIMIVLVLVLHAESSKIQFLDQDCKTRPILYINNPK